MRPNSRGWLAAFGAALIVSVVALVLSIVLKNHSAIVSWIGMIGPVAGIVGLAYGIYQAQSVGQGASAGTQTSQPAAAESTASRDKAATSQNGSIKALFNFGNNILVSAPAANPATRKAIPFWHVAGFVILCLILVAQSIVLWSAVQPNSDAAPTDLTPPQVAWDTGGVAPAPTDVTQIIETLPCVGTCRRIPLDIGMATDVDGDSASDLMVVDAIKLLGINGGGIKPADMGPIDARRCAPHRTLYSPTPIDTPAVPMCLSTSSGKFMMFVRHQNGRTDYALISGE